MSESNRKRVRLSGHTSEEEHAAELGLKPETLQKKRRRGETCAYVKVGRQYFYCNDDKPRWLQSLRVTPPRSAQSGI